MDFRPSDKLNERQVQSGLYYFLLDALTGEGMAIFTGGTFLVAMAVLLKASNFQIGLLAALPVLTNVFQLLSIWLVQRYRNRRAISVICSFFARVPLFIIGLLPLLLSKGTSINILLFFLFFHYLGTSISGASWNSWIKDVVPEKILGTYFSRKARLTQILNVTLSLAIAMLIDYIKSHYPQFELATYGAMFIVGGVIGMMGVYFLSRVPEPTTTLEDQHLFNLISKPLKDVNFRNLLLFHSFYAFATSLALPFFVVYMMQTIGLSFAWIIMLGLLAKFGSIFSLNFWGKFSDKYSNKTIIRICAPTFITCIFSWTFAAMTPKGAASIALLTVIHIVSGVSAAGIDLAIGNLAIKLSPGSEAISYISARNIVVAVFAAAGPMAGGLLADFFASHHLNCNVEWQGPSGPFTLHLLKLQNWSFFFVISAVLALLSIRLINRIREQGEAPKEMVALVMRKSIARGLRSNMSGRAIRERINQTFIVLTIKKRLPFKL